MKIERTKNAQKGIMAGSVLRICQILLPFFMRTVMIRLMGVAYLGINSLFSSILNVLNLAELGVGTAMVFSMYKPIAEDDDRTICALMNLYRKYYRIIGLIIGAVGIAILPMLPHFISGDVPYGLNIKTLYLLNLGATVLSYWLFAYRNCLLQAYQRNDIASIILVVTTILQHALQLVVLWLFRNYYLYVLVLLATQAVNNVVTAIVTKKMYPQYKAEGTLTKEQVGKINRKVRDLFTGKLGTVVLKSSDTIVISSFLGLKVLAIFQNYYFILTSIINVVEIVLSSIIAGLGNCFLTETKKKNFEDLEKFTFLFCWMITICCCCFVALYQPFMRIWVGKELLLDERTMIWFAVYFFAYTLNRLLNVYKDAAGLWHEDRFRPLITAMCNLSLNLLLIRSWGIAGVLLSTVASIVFVGIPWLLRNLFTLLFDRSLLKGYVLQICSYAAVTFVCGLVVYYICAQIQLNDYVSLVVCACIAVIVPNVLLYIVYRKHRLFRLGVQFLDHLTRKRLKLEKRLVR